VSGELKLVTSYFRLPDTYGYPNLTNIVGGFGVIVTKSDNMYTVSIDDSVFSGSGGISVTKVGEQLIVSGSPESQSVSSQDFIDVFAVNQTTDVTTTSTSFVQMGSMSGSLTVNQDSAIMVNFCAVFTTNPSLDALFRVKIDGNVIAGSTRAVTSYEENWQQDAVINCTSTALTAGSHTIAVEWSLGTAGELRCFAGSSNAYSAWLIAQQVTLG